MICKGIISLSLDIVDLYWMKSSFNEGPDRCPLTLPLPLGPFLQVMTASVGVGKVGLRAKTTSDQYSASIIINNLTTHSVFSFFDLLLSSGLVMLLPQKFALFRAEERVNRTSLLFQGHRSTWCFSFCPWASVFPFIHCEVSWHCCFESCNAGMRKWPSARSKVEELTL